MQLAESFLLLLYVSACACLEHHTRHSVPKYLTPCPTNCHCTINNHYTETVDITCQNRTSNGIKLPPSISFLYYVNVSTPFLQSSNLVPTSTGGSNMIKIVYKSSGIKGFSPKTFTKVPYLEHLDLSVNMITDFPATVFQSVIYLRVLNLTENKLEILPHDLLKSQESLLELYLSKNNLSSAYCEVYSNCSVLKILDLSYNVISTLSNEQCFTPSLVVLLLNNNRLKNIPAKIFSTLKQLEVLSLANNEIHITSDLFTSLNSLEQLEIQNNGIVKLPEHSFEALAHLHVLDISKNPIDLLHCDLFKNNLDLNTLKLSETLISHISASLLARLKRLRVLNASKNYRLEKIEDFNFDSSNHLQYIDLSFGKLTILPMFISHLEMVEQLKLDGNLWQCGCKSRWFVEWLENHPHTVNKTLTCDKTENMFEKLASLNCEPPQAVNESLSQVLEFRSTALLTCSFEGEPAPSITWITPSGYIFHHYPNKDSTNSFSSHPRIHLYNLEPVKESRVKLLDNGTLEIQELLRQDAGIYTCIAINPVGNATSHLVVTLDRRTFFHIKIMCIFVGASAVLAVLLCTAVGQLIYWLCQKCGLVEERSKQLMQQRENIEMYKSQQLKSLRENYTQQVHRIKENCALQVEWIRESYQGQVKHIRDFKHYGSHQFSSIRDQYYDQMKKVRDYSTNQLGWVRENYVFQRNRIQKFSSHQVLRFRESYKYQQQTLNKILENLPSLYLDNCRGSSCGRSESSVFVEAPDAEDLSDLHIIDVYTKTKLEDMTNPAVLDEGLDEQSIYYTPSELSESPLSPIKDLLLRKHQLQFTLSPSAYSPDSNRPSTSFSTIPWLQDSPCRVFHCSQSGIQCFPNDNEFQVPRTLQSSTSLPEMPQLTDNEKHTMEPASFHETAL